ncbi:MAG: hypothetical protein JXA57_17795 [Armatimonadetes bacterium]|nr:hypothetical protein [Armatimonadota bacterium]
MNSQAQAQPRVTHVHNGREYLVNEHTGKCWFCGECVRQEEAMETSVLDKPQADTETGEVFERLMFGIAVLSRPMMDCQRRGVINTTEQHFNLTNWALDEGDSMSVKVKEGRWIVTIKKAWEQE